MQSISNSEQGFLPRTAKPNDKEMLPLGGEYEVLALLSNNHENTRCSSRLVVVIYRESVGGKVVGFVSRVFFLSMNSAIAFFRH